MNKHLSSIVQKEMTRKEFLATIGFGAASVMGLSSVIHLLTGKSIGHRLGLESAKSASRSYGYGGSAYGGGKD